MRILLFISTGRCGTQFVTDLLSRAASERAVVMHEPLNAKYNPRKYLRADNLHSRIESEPDISKHFMSWDDALDSGKSIIETGWPIFPWLPYISKRYENHVDVVHIVRNPIRFAFSQASHGYYSKKRLDEYTELAALLPTDVGVKHKRYEVFWPGLNAVEKSLFQWLEINDYAEELAQMGLISLRYRAEEIFLFPNRFLADIRGLSEEWGHVLHKIDSPNDVVDNFKSTLPGSVASVRYAELVSQLAQKYGYSMNLDELSEELMRRFYDKHPK